MQRHLYHGSNKIISRPVFGQGSKHNDYGLGFYCTTNKKIAAEWAARRQGSGFVNEYFLRDDHFKILDLTKSPFDNVLNWIALLMENRHKSSELKHAYPRELQFLKENYLIDLNDFDAVIGYRADDAFYRFPESFVRSEISLNSLEKIYQAGNLGKQYVLVSQRAFKNLKFIDAHEVGAAEKNSYDFRIQKASKYHQKLISEDRYTADIKMIDLVRDNKE